MSFTEVIAAFSQLVEGVPALETAIQIGLVSLVVAAVIWAVFRR